MWIVRDPFHNEIRLTKKCWQDHILVEHPIMAELADELKETIRNPDWIYQSKIHHRSRLYFKDMHRLPYGRFYLMVVVAMKPTGRRGYVKTSFPVYNLSKGGKLLWRKR